MTAGNQTGVDMDLIRPIADDRNSIRFDWNLCALQGASNGNEFDAHPPPLQVRFAGWGYSTGRRLSLDIIRVRFKPYFMNYWRLIPRCLLYVSERFQPVHAGLVQLIAPGI